VLFSHLAGITTRLELVTSVLVLPPRSTPLVAKQAAEVDLLSAGRLRLAVGVGWNFTEYASLGADFETRNQRIEEQIVVLRRVARLADGWMPLLQLTEDPEKAMVRLRALLADAGRDPGSFGLDARIPARPAGRPTGSPRRVAGRPWGRRTCASARGAEFPPRSSSRRRFG
jgi:alkanesulfonate monooxygenase SsuD/methylene tetrahydromethanopterin reductase-like flavin-dependent oxidoreductase (luciferase family)